MSKNLYSAICISSSGNQIHREFEASDVNEAVKHFCEDDNSVLILSRKLPDSDKWYPIIAEPIIRLEKFRIGLRACYLGLLEDVSWFKFRRKIKSSNLNARLGWFSIDIPIETMQAKIFDIAGQKSFEEGFFVNNSKEDADSEESEKEDYSQYNYKEPQFEDLQLIDLPDDFKCSEELAEKFSGSLCDVYKFIPYKETSNNIQILPVEVLGYELLDDLKFIHECEFEQVRCSDSLDEHKDKIETLAIDYLNKDLDDIDSLLKDLGYDELERYENPKKRLNKIKETESIGWDICCENLISVLFEEGLPVMSLATLMICEAVNQLGVGIKIIPEERETKVFIIKNGDTFERESPPKILGENLAGHLGSLFGLSPFVLPPQKVERIRKIGEDTYKLKGENSLNEFGIELTVQWEKVS